MLKPPCAHDRDGGVTEKDPNLRLKKSQKGR